MAEISAFKALRPTRDKVHLVATRPYYTYKKNVLEAKLESNPFTFLHIINPEFRHHENTEPNSAERFELVARSYQEFIDEGILFQDNEPHIYLYRQIKNGHQYIGIIAGASIDEYNEDKIKKHEATLTSREKMFTDYLEIVGYNAEPVLLTYKDPGTDIEQMIAKQMEQRPEYEFTTTDRITHEMWIFNKGEGDEIRKEFSKVNEMYIADGHHRSASSARLRDEERLNSNRYNNQNYFLAFLMNEERINIFEFNRLVKSLNGMDQDEFLKNLENNFTINKLPEARKPESEYQISMCLKGDWYTIDCKPEIVVKEHPVKALIPEILTEYVLTPLLGIEDLKTDENIAFLSGDIEIARMEQLIRKGKFDLGFVLYPLDIEKVKRVADNQMIMPPKSTWIEPKMRSGLTIYKIYE